MLKIAESIFAKKLSCIFYFSEQFSVILKYLFMKNILLFLLFSLFYQLDIFSQKLPPGHTIYKPMVVPKVLEPMQPEKMETKTITLQHMVQKEMPKAFNISQQINMLKAQCPVRQERKSSLTLNGERFNEDIVNLDWQRKNGFDDRFYQLQRSINDTNNFKTVSTVWANEQFRVREKYEQDDENEHTGLSYYRLILSNNQNQIIYSNIVAVKGLAKEKVRVYPNPAKFSTLVYLDTEIDGLSTIQVLDVNGRLLKQEQFTMFRGGNTRTINTEKLIQGAYIIKIIKADKSAVTGRFNKIN